MPALPWCLSNYFLAREDTRFQGGLASLAAVMEAVAAIGLASSIITFIDAATSIVKTANDVYKSADGSSEESTMREAVASSMQDIARRLQRPGHIESGSLHQLAKQCQSLSGDIIALSESTKAPKGSSMRGSLAAGFRSWVKKGTLTQLEQRLDSCKSQLGLELQILTSGDTTKWFAQLQAAMKNDASCIQGLADSIQQLRQSIELQGMQLQGGTLEQTIHKMLHLQEVALQKVFQDRILRSLRFDGMNSRSEQIYEPQGHTFSWILDDGEGSEEYGDDDDEYAYSNDDVDDNNRAAHGDDKDFGGSTEAYDGENDPDAISTIKCNTSQDGSDGSDICHDFRYRAWLDSPETERRAQSRLKLLSWLSSGASIFHISGKLGSGKSTLMRLLFTHPRTRAELAEWADDKELLLVGFFFWRHGSPLQNSLSGLYRSIVHDVLQACPHLIPNVLPGCWAAAKNSPLSDSNIDISATSIEDALKSLVYGNDNSTLFSNYRLCLFIDGLDEYLETENTDYRALADLLNDWVYQSNGNLKMCVSSREENVFMNAFSQDQRLQLHYLTNQDMRIYTLDLLRHISNDYILRELSIKIPERSNGIFLWTALVVRAIRRAVEAHATEENLLELLDQLPSGLEALFQHIIQGLDRKHRTQLLETISMLNQTIRLKFLPYSSQPPPFLLMAYSFFDEYHADPDFATDADFQQRFGLPRNVEGRCIRAEKQLRDKFGGLIETIALSSFSSSEHRYLQFVHRSIPEMFDYGPLAAEMKSVISEFDVCCAFASLSLAALRFTDGQKIHEYHSLGLCCHLMGLLLDNFNPKTFALLRYIDSCIDPPSFEHSHDSTEISMISSVGALTSVLTTMSHPDIAPSNGHTTFFSTLCMAARAGNLPLFEWKLAHCAEPIHIIEKRAIYQLAVLGYQLWNAHLVDLLFNAGFFDSREKSITCTIENYQWHLVAGDGLTCGEHLIVTHFVQWFDQNYVSATDFLLRHGHSLERLLERGGTYNDLRVTVQGSPHSHNVLFEFMDGSKVRMSRDPLFKREAWSTQFLRMRAARYGDSSNARGLGNPAMDNDDDDDDDESYSHERNGENLHDDKWARDELEEEYSLSDWFKSSGYPNTDRLLDMIREEGQKERHPWAAGDSKDEVEPTKHLDTSHIQRCLMALLAIVMGTVLYYIL